MIKVFRSSTLRIVQALDRSNQKTVKPHIAALFVSKHAIYDPGQPEGFHPPAETGRD